MPYLNELIRQQQVSLQQPVGADLGLPRGAAYSSYYPSYEIQTPQYNVPNAFSLAQMGYRTNEVIYACISKRAKTIAQAPLIEYFDSLDDDTEPEEVTKSKIRALLKNANEGIGEKMFHQIHQLYKSIAGFAAWEIEFNNYGEPMRLWPMRPDWCSFLRGQQKPLRAIRYQPYGMPPQDIPIERILFDGYFDPIYPQIRFYSPTMNALHQIGVDNNMTDFLVDFVRHGAKFSGLLSVAQTIDENTAQDYKRRFRDAHGGTQNWSDPLVLGLGAKYESMQMNFRDMAFPELDARTETRICMSFEMSPILVAAKVGLERATLNNYKEAKDAWYDEWVIPEWEITADTIGKKLLSFYHDDIENYYCGFDTRKVRSLQEDRSEQWKRADMGYEGGWVKRNEARAEAGLDPLEGEEGDQLKQPAPSPFEQPTEEQPEVEKEDTEKEVEPTYREKTKAEEAAADAEIKDFQAFVKRRIKEGKIGDIPFFEFKYVEPSKAEFLIKSATVKLVTDKLEKILENNE